MKKREKKPNIKELEKSGVIAFPHSFWSEKKVKGTLREKGSLRSFPLTALVLRTLKGRCGRWLTTSLGSSHLQPQGFRLYRRNAAGSNRDAAAHCNREPRRHRPQLVPRQLLPARTTAPRSFDPETLYDARGRQKCHRRKHLPLSGRRGTPCRLLPPHRDGDPLLGTQIRKPQGWGEGRAHCGGKIGPRSPGISQSPKTGERGYPWCLGKEWNPEAILVCEETTAMAPKEAAPRGTRRTPRNPARPRSFPWNPEHRAAAEDGSRGFVLTLPSKLFSSTSLMSARRSPELNKRQVSAWGPMA